MQSITTTIVILLATTAWAGGTDTFPQTARPLGLIRPEKCPCCEATRGRAGVDHLLSLRDPDGFSASTGSIPTLVPENRPCHPGLPSIVVDCGLAGEAMAPNEVAAAKDWTRVGPLGETPKRTTEAYPLSDQGNRGRWVKFEPMSDEFEGKQLDEKKWTLNMAWWQGRQPAVFSAKNVTVADGKLHLVMRKEKLSEELGMRGYHDYSSAALFTKARSSYGYYEVMARPMNSGGSSSFWFQQDETPGWGTEIDVFEIGGKAKGFERKYNMNLHVFRTPSEKRHSSVGGVWESPWRLADAYHVYGLEWAKDRISYYVDGVLVRFAENTHWHQPLYLIFDSETMPDWFGMPEDSDLPSTFSVEYVRAWKKEAGVP
ncbi:MAG: family 16 glycosylhydrolase [Pirellulales bacterium]